MFVTHRQEPTVNFDPATMSAISGAASGLITGGFGLLQSRADNKANAKSQAELIALQKEQAKANRFSAMFGSSNKLIYIVLGFVVVAGIVIYLINRK